MRRFTVPPMLPSRADAWVDLSTSAPEITSEGSTSNARSRLSSSLARMRLLSVVMLYCGPRPRTLTWIPSPPVVRSIVMPGRCSKESATSASGNRPSSVELIESNTTEASLLISRDFSRLARTPVTMISCSSWESAPPAAPVAASAAESLVLSAANAGKAEPSEAMATSKAERRRIVGIAIPFLNSLSMALRSTKAGRRVGSSDVKRN